MKIGVNSLFLVPGDVGGTEIYFRNNLREMVRQYPDNIFTIFTTEDNDFLLREDLAGYSNVEFVRLKFRSSNRPFRIILEQTLLPIAGWRNKIDVLWSPGYTAPLICHCPQVVTIHDLQYKSHPDDMSSLERITLDVLVRCACKRCERVIAVSEFSRKEIVKYDFAPREKVVAVLEGVDQSFAQNGSLTDEEFYAGLGLEKGTPFILCIAHSYPHKNIHLLVDAFKLMMDRIPHHLVLAGKARRGEPALKKSIEALPDQTRLHRLTDLDFEQIKMLYRKADVFVLPSSYEGFGLPVLEAMMSGTPVVIPEKASLPEVGGEQSFYLDSLSAESLKNKIAGLLDMDAGELNRRKNDARKWASNFTWEKSAANTMKVIMEV